MPDGLKRYYGRGHLHFITFSCYRRRPLLRTLCARDVFVEELNRVRDEMKFRLAGYVVMPEHVHLLMGESPQGTPSMVLQKLKQRVSRWMQVAANQLRVEFDNAEGSATPFWQARFYDFNVYSDGKRSEKLNYMHANPVIRKLVKHPKDWPWSSWSHYRAGREGMIRIDALGDTDEVNPKTHPQNPRVGHPT